MRWTERQHTLLAGLGLKLWQAPAAHSAPAAHPAPPPPLPTVVRPHRPPPAVAPSVPVRAPDIEKPPLVAAPVMPGVAALDWAGLRQAVASCEACSLCRSRTQTVFGVGAERADVMIVGEAPGEQEDLRGEPFVGPAGQLLDNMLRAIGHSRAPSEGSPLRPVFIANTLKCRPPRNRNPDAQELARCLPFLYRQIELVQPRLLLASGKFAIQALLDTPEAVGRLRGRVHQFRGIPVVVTYHPAYLLRQLTEKSKAWDDLCLAMHTLSRSPNR
jgi:uracil-DNA glycosylase